MVIIPKVTFDVLVFPPQGHLFGEGVPGIHPDAGAGGFILLFIVAVEIRDIPFKDIHIRPDTGS